VVPLVGAAVVLAIFRGMSVVVLLVGTGWLAAGLLYRALRRFA
jgi:hypothetical protein